MKKMRRLFWLLPVFLVILVTGCLKDDVSQGTIVLMGTESDVKPIEQMGIDTLLTFVADTNVMGTPVLTLPTGNTPPNIQGQFVFAPMEMYKWNNDHPAPNDTLFIRFGDSIVSQHNRIVRCYIKGDVMEEANVYQTKRVDKAFVMGSGNNFTVYFTVVYQCEEQNAGVRFNLTRGYVITGTMTPSGIDHAVMACVNIEVSDAVQAMKDRIYIYHVKNSADNPTGMAVRYTWDH